MPKIVIFYTPRLVTMNQSDKSYGFGTNGMKMLVAFVVMTSAYDFFTAEGLERFFKAGAFVTGSLFLVFKSRQDEFFLVFLSLLLASFITRNFL